MQNRILHNPFFGKQVYSFRLPSQDICEEFILVHLILNGFWSYLLQTEDEYTNDVTDYCLLNTKRKSNKEVRNRPKTTLKNVLSQVIRKP
jgi:hypothetical protein